MSMADVTQEEFLKNKIRVVKAVDEIVEKIKYAKNKKN